MSVRALVSTNLYVCGKERSLNTVRETHIDAEGKKRRVMVSESQRDRDPVCCSSVTTSLQLQPPTQALHNASLTYVPAPCITPAAPSSLLLQHDLVTTRSQNSSCHVKLGDVEIRCSQPFLT